MIDHRINQWMGGRRSISCSHDTMTGMIESGL